MNAKLLTIILILSALLGACAPSAPQPVAQEPRATAPRYEQPAATEAPAAPAQPYNPTTSDDGNYHQDFGVNPEERTSRDHLSTFALDVDTASYTVARRYINEGTLPPMDAVRAEEFVNAFDQGYAAPDTAAFTIYADGAPNPFGEDGTYYLRFGVQGYRVPEWQRKPLALTFVIDISGSMDMENRLGLVKRSLRLLVERLDERDSVSIIVYGSQARVALEPTSGDQYKKIQRTIDRLDTEGSTNAEAGLRLGYQYAMHTYNPEASNRVILCSDGVANTGQTDADRLVEMIGGYVAEGVNMTALGFGMGNFNDALLERLADRGNGNYAYIDTLDEAERLFIDEIISTMEVIAYDAKVQVDFNPDVVTEYRLVGYENREVADQDFRDDSVDAGEIGAGHSATAVYQVRLAPAAEGRIATIQLRWQDAETRDVKEINGNFNTWDLYTSYEESDAYYQNTVLVAAFAEILRASPYTDANLEMIAQMARQVARRFPDDEQIQEFSELTWQAERLSH